MTGALTLTTRVHATEDEELEPALQQRSRQSVDDAGGDNEATREGLPFVYELWLGGRYAMERRIPEAALVLDEDSGLWRDDALLRPQPARRFPSFFVSGTLEIELVRGLSLATLIDTGDLRSGASLEPPLDAILTSEGRTLGEAFTQGLMLRELALVFHGGFGNAWLGRRRTAIAEGLVYDDFGNGAALNFEGDALVDGGYRVGLTALTVGRTFDELDDPSPLFSLELELLPSLFESLGVFAAYFKDNAGTLSEVFRSIGAERIVLARLSNEPGIFQLNPVCLENALQPSECRRQILLNQLFVNDTPNHGWMSYVGVEGKLLPAEGVSTRATFVYALGEMEVEGPTRTLHLEVGAWAGQLAATVGLTETLGAGVFGFALSGDEPFDFLEDDRSSYSSFMGVAPLWTWTGLFFSGGLSQGFYAGRASSAGVNGRGVLGGGLVAEFAGERLTGEARLAWLEAFAASPPAPLGGGGTTYGIETDWRVELFIQKWLSVGGEVDLFWPGDFFPERDVAFRGLVQVLVHHG